MTMKDSPSGKRPRADVNPRRLLTLKIDDRDVSAREDETILAVARQNGIVIPTLCHLDGLSERGACRLCIVEIKGMTRLAAACVTLVRQDMEVLTATERVLDYRRKILELIFSERNHVCSVCVSNGHCDLQDLATQLGMTHVRYDSRWTTTAACCACAACGSATRSKGPTPGISCAGGSPPRSLPI